MRTEADICGDSELNQLQSVSVTKLLLVPQGQTLLSTVGRDKLVDSSRGM